MEGLVERELRDLTEVLGTAVWCLMRAA